MVFSARLECGTYEFSSIYTVSNMTVLIIWIFSLMGSDTTLLTINIQHKERDIELSKICIICRDWKDKQLISTTASWRIRGAGYAIKEQQSEAGQRA